jgi:hypothetical protein
MSDYGRSGVATDLYEGTMKLTDKYVNEAQSNAITTGMIQNSQVTTEKIASNAVTNFAHISGGNFDIASKNTLPLPGASLNLSTTGGPVLLNFNCCTSGYSVGEPTDVGFALFLYPSGEPPLSIHQMIS